MSHLKDLREEKGLTIEQVAEELTEKCKRDKGDKYGNIYEVKAAAYGQWERRNRNPTVKYLHLLADYWRVTTDYILERSDERLQRIPSVLDELGLKQEPWWEIKREATHDERACSKVFAWIASGKSIDDVLRMTNDEDWRVSKWGKKPDEGIVRAMLMRALDDGPVDIIADKIPLNEELAEALKNEKEFRFLKNVKVIKSPENKLLAKILVGEAAAQFLDEIVRPGHSVGFSGGTTLARMATALKKYPCEGLKLYPFDNGLVPESVDICANTLIGRIKYSHPGANIDAFALQHFGFDDSPRAYSFPPNLPSVQKVIHAAETVDVGWVGFGAITDDLVRENPAFGGVLANARTTIEDLIKKDGAVGDILFHVIKIDGTHISNKLNRRIASVHPGRLRNLVESEKQVVGVACDRVKGDAGLALLRGKYVNNLIIDDKLAAAILKAKEQPD